MTTETLKRAYQRTKDQRGFDTDVENLRQVAVKNLKRKITSRNKLNSIASEWLVAREEQKRWSLRK